MNTIKYYRARCGSIYRVTTTEATRKNPATCKQARKSTHAKLFSPEYDTHPEEVQRQISFGAFTEIPAP